MTATAQSILNRPPKTMMEVFESLPEGTLVQLINNQLVMSPAPSFTHQKVSADLFNLIYNFVGKSKLGLVLTAPFDVYLNSKNAFRPDIIFVANENLSLIKENGLHGAPDMAIEIISTQTCNYDLEDKMEVYAAGGVKEYWIVEPHEKRAKGYWLTNHEYHLFAEEVGLLHSRLMNKKFKF